MEEATSTEQPAQSPGQLVDTDDLVFMIGSKEIALLNQKKALEAAARTIRALQQNPADVAEFKKRNKNLGEKNLELERRLAEVRQKATAEKVALRAEIDSLKEKLAKLRAKFRAKFKVASKGTLKVVR